jgi:hypothetical protein
MQGQAYGVGHCKETGLTSWMWPGAVESLKKETWKPGDLKFVQWMWEVESLKNGTWKPGDLKFVQRMRGVETEKLILQPTYPFQVRSMQF